MSTARMTAMRRFCSTTIGGPFSAGANTAPTPCNLAHAALHGAAPHCWAQIMPRVAGWAGPQVLPRCNRTLSTGDRPELTHVISHLKAALKRGTNTYPFGRLLS